MVTPRREFLCRAGAGAATVWVAPMVLSANAAAGGSAAPDPDPPDPPDLPRAPTMLGVHPWAAAQPTSWGRQLQDLALFDGIVFCGYGDWNSNTGPIAASGWHLASSSFVNEAALGTESTWLLRRIGNRLVVPFIDEKGGAGDLAVRSLGASTWTTIATGAGASGSIHTFDVATSNGTDLWVAGARIGSNTATVWHSPSGLGGDWVVLLDVSPSGGAGWYARFTAIASYGGSIFVAGYEFGPALVAVGLVAKRFDGTDWVDAPEFSLDASGHRHGHEPQAFDGRMLRRVTNPRFAEDRALVAFDGVSLSATGISAVQWHVDAAGRLWWVSSDLFVRRQNPGGTPLVVATAPVGTSCIVAEGTDLYLGTVGSELWHASLS